MAKIAHLSSVHPRSDVRIYHKMCVSLASSNHEVVLVVADGLGSGLENSIKFLDVGRRSNRISRIAFATKDVFFVALRLKADLYHIHDPELLPAGLLLKKLGHCVVFDSHEDVPKQVNNKHYLAKPVAKAISLVYSIVEKWICKRLSGVVSATPTIEQKFTTINSNSVNVNNFPILTELLTKNLGGERNQEICYVGVISKERGVFELIDTLNMIDGDVKLNLAGGFIDENTRLQVKQKIDNLKVNYLGYLDRKGVRKILNRSLAGVVALHPTTNYIEALPVKLFEYMAAGIPVVASDFPIIKKIIDDHKCGLLVDPLSPQSIAAALNFLIANPEKSTVMGRNGRQAVEKYYNWNSEYIKLHDFYLKTISSHNN